ncbi:hypothetical protein niasHT_038536 [Heterodera trifolii]|uniref:Uncharacterized protein n=1 Tax=Heterodera trifolii TaxID=157864 RepID=A0ABD2IJD5_9BILA
MSPNTLCSIVCLLLVCNFIWADDDHRSFAEELVRRLRRSHGYSVGYGGNCACSFSAYPATASHTSYTAPKQTSYSSYSCSGSGCGHQAYQTPQKTSYHWCTGTACNKPQVKSWN